jgi:hypothetical protein
LSDVYQHPDRIEPDSEFVPGSLDHLVVGNCGRLRDPRRTPILLTAIDVESGEFEVEIAAFEDRGAHWRIPFEEISKFQFARDSARVDPAPFILVAERLDRPLRVPADGGVRVRTDARIAAESTTVTEWLRSRWRGPLDVASCDGDDNLCAALDAVMEERGLADLELSFAASFVSNPGSGELVKGHAIVAAELGLCTYVGKIVRSPQLFEGAWSRRRRAAHLVTRLAFIRAFFRLSGLDTVLLYRGVASDHVLEPRPANTFVSATFSREVAEAHFAGGPTTVAAALFRARVPVTQLVMTHLETRAMNARYREAEAVLLGEPPTLGLVLG